MFRQEQLDLFSQITGDFNPIHTKEYFEQHPEQGGVIVQGMLAASKFGMVFGTEFPGPGTINVERGFTFHRPIFSDQPYRMNLNLTSVDTESHTASLKLTIEDSEGKVCISGNTIVKNDSILTIDNYPKLQRKSVNCIANLQLPEPDKKGGVSLSEALSNRRSMRYFVYETIDDQMISNLLWSACGVSSIKGDGDDVKYLFTNPTASNHQEVSVYAFMENGTFLYAPKSNELLQLDDKDHRKELSPMPMVKKAAITLCLVSDVDKMVHHTDTFRQQLYSSMDTGYVSENIYLFCAANGLATCACGLIDREKIKEILGLTNARVMLVHPIGIKKEKQ